MTKRCEKCGREIPQCQNECASHSWISEDAEKTTREEIVMIV